MEFRLVRKLDICGVANVQFQDCKYRILHTTLTREIGSESSYWTPTVFSCVPVIHKAPLGHESHPPPCLFYFCSFLGCGQNKETITTTGKSARFRATDFCFLVQLLSLYERSTVPTSLLSRFQFDQFVLFMSCNMQDFLSSKPLLARVASYCST